MVSAKRDPIMPRNTELATNGNLRAFLQEKLHSCALNPRAFRVVERRPEIRPDLIVSLDESVAIMLTSKFEPAIDVENNAIRLLGSRPAELDRHIGAAIALCYPDEVATADNLRSALTTATLRYCAFKGTTTENERLPEMGWFEGSLTDLFDFTLALSMPLMAAVGATTWITGDDDTSRSLFLTDEDARGVREGMAQRNFNMSLDEFREAWRAGEFDDDQERHVDAVGLAMMLPEYWED